MKEVNVVNQVEGHVTTELTLNNSDIFIPHHEECIVTGYTKKEPISIFDAVKQGIPLLSLIVSSVDKGRITVCVPVINHCYSQDYVGAIFENKSITIGKNCGYFSFTKVEALSDAITLKQKVEQKSYVGVYKHTTVLPTSIIEEISLVTNEDKWYTDINNMLVDYQKDQKK